MRAALELLEDRIAPALLLNPRTVLFRDLDNRLAEIKLSEPLFAAATVNSVLTFDAGSVDGSTVFPQQLQEIDLSGLAVDGAHPLSVSVFAAPARGAGQSFVDVGLINAPGVNFHNLEIHGDLGAIVAGDGANDAPAIARLSVQSMGNVGTESQQAGGALVSSIAGSVGHLSAEADLNSVTLDVSGDLRSLSIGGNLLGGAAAQSGGIEVSGALAACTIAGSIEGGAGPGSGTIFAQSIGVAKIGGSVLGGPGNSSGSLFANAAIGQVSLGGDLRGNAGLDSGSVVASGNLGSATIRGSIIGGSGGQSGEVESSGNLHRFRLAHDLDGGAGLSSGEIVCDGNLIGSLVVQGAVNGGSGSFSGLIQDAGSAALVRIRGGISGAAADSALLEIEGNVTTLHVGASVLGGAGSNSGEVFIQGNMRTAVIDGDLTGGSGADTGLLQIGGDAGQVRVMGSVFGGSASVSGEIFCTGNLALLQIRGGLEGGSVSGTGSANGAGYLQAANFGRIEIGGSIVAGINSGTGVLSASGSIRAVNQIGSLHVAGSLLGNAGETVVISAQGAPLSPGDRRDAALGGIEIGGGVFFSEVLAGYSTALQPVDGHAQIGPVFVRGDWLASSLVAGIQSGSAEGFGTPADTVIPNSVAGVALLSRIAKVVIQGEVLGNAAGGAEYAFEAESIGAFVLAGRRLPAASLAAGIEIAPTGDVTVREVQP